MKEHIMSVETSHMRVDYNVYEGMMVHGKPVQVYLRGKKLVDGEDWFGKNGAGQFIPRKPDAAVL